MILTCPSCGTRYRADPASLGSPGRNVRCAKCGHVWFQPAPEPSNLPELSASADAAVQKPEAAPGHFGSQRKLTGPAAKDTKPAGWLRRARDAKPQTLVFSGLLVLLAIVGWTADRYRQEIVRLWPASARFYASVGSPVEVGNIAIRNIDLRRESQDGTQVLAVTGRLINISDHDQPIPRLRVVLLDNSNRELYRWTFDPGFTSLPPGAERDFGTTLPNPPPDAHAANVNFAAEDIR